MTFRGEISWFQKLTMYYFMQYKYLQKIFEQELRNYFIIELKEISFSIDPFTLLFEVLLFPELGQIYYSYFIFHNISQLTTSF